MKNKHFYAVLTFTVIFVFITSLFTVVNVSADEGTPPVPTEEPALPPTEEPAAETGSTPTSTPEADTPVEILESAPEGVDVIVLDENGDPMSLVVEEAAQIIMIGDPMWCPDGDTPGTDALDSIIECTPSFASFTDLINELTTNTATYNGSGTIYVAYDYDATVAGDAGSDIIFDYGDLALTNLAVQGGWDFTSDSVFGTSTIDLGTGNSVEFWDWGGYATPGSLTLRDIIITNSDGLYIGDDSDFTTADVTLDNVGVIDTTWGTYIGTEGDVNISNSNFNDTQADDGLVVENSGTITLTDVIATGNSGSGAILDNSCGCVTTNIFISSSSFDLNGTSEYDRGLIAHSNGDIALANVSASGNSGGGAELINCFFDFYDFTGCFNTNPATITITGTNIFNNNGYIPPQFLGSGPYGSVGLWAGSNNGVSISGVTAQNNGAGDIGGGALLFTQAGNLFVTNSNFNENCMDCYLGFGFIALNLGGDVTLDGVTANGTGNQASYTPTQGLGGMIFNLSGNTIVKNSDFSENCSLDGCFGAGLGILSFGDVYLNHVTANNNGTAIGGGMGATINTGNNIDIYCSTFNNNFGSGLLASAPGVINLNGVTSSGNSIADSLSYGSLNINPFDCDPEGKSPRKAGLPINIIPVTGGLDCTAYSGTLLILPNGDNALFPCPIQDEGRIEVVTSEDLPADLPEGNEFISSFTTFLFKDGQTQEISEGLITISFMIPDGADKEALSILHWNGTEWIDLGGAVSEDGLHFEVPTKLIGTFVLVSK